jgi:hypothetical protein
MDLTASVAVPTSQASLRERLNTRWHERSLQVFMLIVLGHWSEHLAQAFQSEVLHYSYAVVMLFGIWLLRPGFTGLSRTWWNVALIIQFWHHIEHALLQGQVLFHHNLFNRPVPTSLAQLWVPRVELHLIYNTLVFIPMVIAMYYHMFPPQGDAAHMRCTCAVQPRVAAVA